MTDLRKSREYMMNNFKIVKKYNKKYNYWVGGIIKIIVCIFAVFKSIFFAITQVAWGIAGIFFFSIGLFYLKEHNYVNYTSVLNYPVFREIVSYIFNNIDFFVVVFLVVSLYFEIKEIFK